MQTSVQKFQEDRNNVVKNIAKYFETLLFLKTLKFRWSRDCLDSFWRNEVTNIVHDVYV